jgi:hypothetical protein
LDATVDARGAIELSGGVAEFTAAVEHYDRFMGR